MIDKGNDMPNQPASHDVDTTTRDDPERYRLSSRQAIVRVLYDLNRKGETVTAAIAGSEHQMVTSVLDVLPDRKLVILDFDVNEVINRKALGAERIHCFAKHDKVDVRFSCSDLRRARYQGDWVLAAPIPDSLFRFQRREYFRVGPLSGNPLALHVPSTEFDPLEATAIDVGVGGVALHDRQFRMKAETGLVYEECTFTLPCGTEVPVDLEIRNAVELSGRDNRVTHRVGCQFHGLAAKDLFAIQRYINAIQAEQRALAAD